MHIKVPIKILSQSVGLDESNIRRRLKRRGNIHTCEMSSNTSYWAEPLEFWVVITRITTHLTQEEQVLLRLLNPRIITIEVTESDYNKVEVISL